MSVINLLTVYGQKYFVGKTLIGNFLFVDNKVTDGFIDEKTH
jgi:hypothetical protein